MRGSLNVALLYDTARNAGRPFGLCCPPLQHHRFPEHQERLVVVVNPRAASMWHWIRAPRNVEERVAAFSRGNVPTGCND